MLLGSGRCGLTTCSVDCGDDVAAITTAIESCIEQRQELWRYGMTEEVPGLTATIDLLWEALRYARLAEPPWAAA